jgi:hypothetical protein
MEGGANMINFLICVALCFISFHLGFLYDKSGRERIDEALLHTLKTRIEFCKNHINVCTFFLEAPNTPIELKDNLKDCIKMAEMLKNDAIKAIDKIEKDGRTDDGSDSPTEAQNGSRALGF